MLLTIQHGGFTYNRRRKDSSEYCGRILVEVEPHEANKDRSSISFQFQLTGSSPHFLRCQFGKDILKDRDCLNSRDGQTGGANHYKLDKTIPNVDTLVPKVLLGEKRLTLDCRVLFNGVPNGIFRFHHLGVYLLLVVGIRVWLLQQARGNLFKSDSHVNGGQ
jgi:hypothetical protein